MTLIYITSMYCNVGCTNKCNICKLFDGVFFLDNQHGLYLEFFLNAEVQLSLQK